MTKCLVKGCTGKTFKDRGLCSRCYVMLSQGSLLPSSAWFAVELEFVNQQNHHAMEQVRLLHDKVNDLMGEEE